MAEHDPTTRVPDVSVVVPTVDRVALLDRCLAALARQEGVELEVLVVHDGDAGVAALLERWAGSLPLQPIQVDERGAAAKRNAGWRAARSDVVAFTDDDCAPAPGWLTAALAALGPGVDLVQGPIAPHPDDHDVRGPFARTLDHPGPNETYPTANLVCRRGALAHVGGFDEAFWGGGEDTDLAWRVLERGGRAAFAPSALVHHAIRPADLAAHLRSLPRWATLALVLRRHPQLRRLLHRKVFWKRSHPAAVLAAAGLVLAPLDVRSLVLVLPVLARRVREAGLGDGAQLAVADLAEVGVVVAGSIRYRAVLL